MDWQTFASRSDARDHRDDMREHGWPQAVAVQLYIPGYEHANEHGFAWVIRATPTLYLRLDGYVR